MRERPKECGFSYIPGGITPARAGKTISSFRPWAAIWDHPRSCGKDFPCLCGHELRMGSPPLVRERPTPGIPSRTRRRITPARAGKTMLTSDLWRWSRDHPRSCGKDHARQACQMQAQGSPPLVRERLLQEIGNVTRFGITPARAGKTVMDPFICAISLLPVFKIYLISFQSISTLQLLRNLGGC